jgi:hypothetical protein
MKHITMTYRKNFFINKYRILNQLSRTYLKIMKYPGRIVGR